MPADKEALRLLNDSGFPLQVAVQAMAEDWRRKHSWGVNYVEHSWRNEKDNTFGFIDLVLTSGDTFLLVECKRVRDATWLFMHSRGRPDYQRQVKLWISEERDKEVTSFGWFDVTAEPPTPEANFCAIRGQNTSERVPLIERYASELASAVEGFAHEHWPMRAPAMHSRRAYASAIVTTAKLKLATFEPTELSLESGTLQEADFVEVPFLRFRKQVLIRSGSDRANELPRKPRSSYEKESTLFVVQAARFNEFLEQFKIHESGLSAHSVA